MSCSVMGNNPFVNGKLPSSPNISKWGKTCYMKNKENKLTSVLQKNLFRLLEIRKLEAKSVSLSAKVGATYVSDILGNKVLDPTSGKLGRVASVLGATLEQLYDPNFDPSKINNISIVIKSDENKPKFSDIENGLLAINFGFISHYIEVNPGYKEALLRTLNSQIRFFHLNEQPNVAAVLSRLVENVTSDIRKQEIPPSHKNAAPSQDQYLGGKD